MWYTQYVLFELGHRATTALQEALVELRRHLNISTMPGVYCVFDTEVQSKPIVVVIVVVVERRYAAAAAVMSLPRTFLYRGRGERSDGSNLSLTAAFLARELS